MEDLSVLEAVVGRGGSTRDASEAYRSGRAQGYVLGVYDAMRRQLCIPPGTSSTQLLRVVTKQLQENPGRLHLAGHALVEQALQNEFFCRK